MTDNVRVVVVDDHEIVRAGLATLLAREPDIHVVGLAGDGNQALDVIRDVQPDVAVVDYRLPGMTGVELCERLRATAPSVAVVMLTTYLEDAVVRRALEAGARAFVYKDVQAHDLARAIRSVAKGDAVLDPKVAGRVAQWAQKRRLVAADVALSSRETEVIRLVAKGMQNRDIAAELHVSVNTVRTYLQRTLAKLGCQSRTEAAAVAAQRGLL